MRRSEAPSYPPTSRYALACISSLIAPGITRGDHLSILQSSVVLHVFLCRHSIESLPMLWIRLHSIRWTCQGQKHIVDFHCLQHLLQLRSVRSVVCVPNAKGFEARKGKCIDAAMAAIPQYMLGCMQGRLRWQDLLLSRLTERTKLVGPTISCESSPKNGDVNGEWRTNPHVQSVFAMDKVTPPPSPPPPPHPQHRFCGSVMSRP